MGDLSPHFSTDEFRCPRTGVVIVNLTLVSLLEQLRTALGDVPIRITSGYRTPEYNRSLGGAEDSQHVTGAAADIVVAGRTMAEVADAARAVGFSGIGLYNNHVHVDVRPGARAEWSGVSV